MKKIDPKALHLANTGGGKIFIETYGCMMNVGDSEVVFAIMEQAGYSRAENADQADVILINTCAIRDNAEQRIWGRLKELRPYKKRHPWLLVGVIGCMAERLKEQLIEQERVVDMVIGPDAYRTLPELIKTAATGRKSINVKLSREETYAEITPVRTDTNGVSAFISIMRGCNNMCSYCVVPYTRGGERSRTAETIIAEAEDLFARGYREVTLLGQNVNSYRSSDYTFESLLARVASISPTLRVRFSTSHPKDLSDELISVIASKPNICRSIHLPAQSGSTRMLGIMNRKYTREWYLDRMTAIRRAIPDCTITTDLIAGFCTETIEDQADTLSLMRLAAYDFAYMYKYSERPDTLAARSMVDDVPEVEKNRRLTEIIDLQQELSLRSNKADVGKVFEVLVDGVSKRSVARMSGRTSQNKVVIFDCVDVSVGDYVMVKITGCSSATLQGVIDN